jgi:hypothetical protein
MGRGILRYILSNRPGGQEKAKSRRKTATAGGALTEPLTQ